METPINQENTNNLEFENRIDLNELQESVFKIKKELQKVIVGQKDMMDLLIVSLSSAGIYVCLETIKHLSINETSIRLWLKFSGVFFLFSIIINFFSQIFGYKANEKDFLMCQVEIETDEKMSKKEKVLVIGASPNSSRYSFIATEIGGEACCR